MGSEEQGEQSVLAYFHDLIGEYGLPGLYFSITLGMIKILAGTSLKAA
jgi:hypothetical protein